MSYGNGWIMGENGKPWHPVLSSQEKEVKQRGNSWLSKVMPCWVN
ncbi:MULTISPECIES: phage filamentation protein Fil family protein [Pantoea]